MKRIKKRLAAITLMAIVSMCANAQSKIYNNSTEGVSFIYPNAFKKVAILNARHMLLELEKGNVTISLSKWNYGIDDSYSIWDEEIVEIVRENLLRTGASLVSLDKRHLVTKSGKKKSLVIISNAPNVNLHLVTYQFLHKGNLFQIVVSNKGTFDKMKLPIYDSYVGGLTLK